MDRGSKQPARILRQSLHQMHPAKLRREPCYGRGIGRDITTKCLRPLGCILTAVRCFAQRQLSPGDCRVKLRVRRVSESVAIASHDLEPASIFDGGSVHCSSSRKCRDEGTDQKEAKGGGIERSGQHAKANHPQYRSDDRQKRKKLKETRGLPQS